MVVEVYADILFFLNAGMDALCFCLTADILHRKITRWRLALGAALGGVYAVVSLFPDLTSLPHADIWAIAADIAVCLLLSFLVFARRGESIRRVLGAAAAYTAVSMVMGGVMTALYHLLNRLHLPFLSSGEDGSSASAILFALVAGVGGLMTARGGRIFRQKQATRAYTVTVTVLLDGREITVDGMVDSGNLLRDPIGGKPVVVMDAQALAPLLSPALSAVVHADGVHKEAGLSGEQWNRLSAQDRRRIRLIPTGTATGQGLLPAVVVDRLTITSDGQPPREVDALVGSTHLTGVPARALIPAELA